MVKITTTAIRTTASGVIIGDAAFPGMITMENYARETSPAASLLGAGSLSLDCNNQSLFRKTGGTCTITLQNMQENQQINLSMESTGSAYTLTFAGETFKWGSGTQPTPTATASKVDIYSFIKIAGIVYGNAILGF